MKRKQKDLKYRRRAARRERARRGLLDSSRVRLTVYRSARHIYAQLDDPASGCTLGTISSRSQAVLGDVSSPGGVEAAKKVGEAVAKLAKEKRIVQVVFNRNGFLYHGRIKALADAARAAGLEF